MAIAIVLTLAIASIVGFCIGYRFAKMKLASSGSSPGSSVYDSATLLKTKLANPCDATIVANHIDNMYGCLGQKLNETSNLVVTMQDAKSEKNLFVLNNGTLPKDYKTRKVYL